MILRGEGYTVIEAEDGTQALVGIQVHRPPLAILDVMMPGLSGLAVCQRVRTNPALADTRLIVISADAIESEVLKAGADLFLSKPCLPSHILGAIHLLSAM